jgi:MoaA/NifB/PqqE/SkfB family radical SAM enzyme
MSGPVALALEAIDCSNRCRHCEATYGPHRRHLSREEVASWSDRVRAEADRLGVQVQLTLNNSELLDHPQWREVLQDLGEGLGPGFATNGHKIARCPDALVDLRERGVQWVQLTLGGASPGVHDRFAGRTGAFDDIVATAELAHARGLHVVWQYIAYRPLAEIGRMSVVAVSRSAPFAAGKYDHKGGVDQTICLVKPQNRGAQLEHLRPKQAELAELPEWAALDRFARAFGAGCETEGELVAALTATDRAVGCLETGNPECGGCGLVLCRNGDVYPYCHERHPAYLLGNINHDGLGSILERHLGTNPPLALTVRRRGLPELAASYGDPTSAKLHSGCSLCRTLVGRALHHEWGQEPGKD